MHLTLKGAYPLIGQLGGHQSIANLNAKIAKILKCKNVKCFMRGLLIIN